MPTLADLAAPSNGLLGDVSAHLDNRKRQIVQLAMGLLNYPAETIAQLKQADGEAAARNRYTQHSARSVMPEVAQQGNEAMMQAALNVGGLLGMTAYHGSPHLFDKFDMSKVGSGTGNASRGHGIYMSERADIAKQYAGSNGNLYKVDIPDEQVEKMLGWAEPLSKQPHVKNALKDAEIAHSDETTGGQVMSRLYEKLGDTAAVSKKLRDLGIPGIRYSSDMWGRAGKPSNFVLFDDTIPKITGRE